jgi:hypothetical protein
LPKPTIGDTIMLGVRNSTTLMYSSMGSPRMLSWLLAAAIAVQPVSGFSCGCGGVSGDSGTRPTRQRCCCCCSGSVQPCCCCGSSHHGKMVSKPQRTCCQRRADRDRDNAPSGVSACKCGSGAPAAPQSVPAERSHTDDLATSVLCAHVVTVDVPVGQQAGWAGNLPTEFASASEHCIALCRLRF